MDLNNIKQRTQVQTATTFYIEFSFQHITLTLTKFSGRCQTVAIGIPRLSLANYSYFPSYDYTSRRYPPVSFRSVMGGEESLPSSVENIGPKRRDPFHRRVKSYFTTEIDAPNSTNLISIYACFLTGFTSAPSFTACYVWCGFQTGNVAQLGVAIARCFAPGSERTFGFQKPDQQALTSLLSFWIGTSLGRFGDWSGARKRTWLALATLLQAFLAMAAALTAHYSGEDGIASLVSI